MCMKNEKKIYSFAPLIICILLFLFYLLSFTSLISGRNAEKKITSAILNKKYENTVHKIEIHALDQTVLLFRNKTIWSGIITINGIQNTSVFSVDKTKIESFIKLLIRLRDMYIISDNSRDLISFKSQNNNNCYIAVYGNSDNLYTKIYYIRNISPFNRLTFLTDNAKALYQTEDDFNTCLGSGMETWCDPFIIPRTVFDLAAGKNLQRLFFDGAEKSITVSDIPAILDLRHGEIFYGKINADQKHISTLRIELGDTSVIKLDFYCSSGNKKDNSYICDYIFYPGVFFPENLRREINDLHYQVRLSDWSYHSLLSLLKSG